MNDDPESKLEKQNHSVHTLVEGEQERPWLTCCSRTSPAAARYFTVVSICAAVIAFSATMLAIHADDPEARGFYGPLLSGTLMLLVDPPRHDT